MDYEFSIREDNEFGFKYVYPRPSQEELDEFYEDNYYELVEGGEVAPSLSRILENDEGARDEIKWLSDTKWTDIEAILRNHVNSTANILDVGCGLGHFTKFMDNAGWSVTGIEPSVTASKIAQNEGLEVINTTLTGYYESTTQRYDVVCLIDVLEHLRNPIQAIEMARNLTRRDGLLVIESPNEFNPLQEMAKEQLCLNQWWVNPPVHLNYFDFDSLDRLLNFHDFIVEEKLSDFPMEFFLLFGDDYVSHDKIGSKCHQKRVNFERALEDELRRNLYKSYAEIGIGRHALMFARSN